MFFCLEMHANEANGSIQSRIDPFASFTCTTADNCDNSYSAMLSSPRAGDENNLRSLRLNYWVLPFAIIVILHGVPEEVSFVAPPSSPGTV